MKRRGFLKGVFGAGAAVTIGVDAIPGPDKAVKEFHARNDGIEPEIQVFYQDEAPDRARYSIGKGDLWFDTLESNKMYRFNGNYWENVT